MTKVGGIRKIMVLWQAVFLAASPLVTAPPSNLTRLYYNGSAAKSHSTTTQYRQLRRLTAVELLRTLIVVHVVSYDLQRKHCIFERRVEVIIGFDTDRY